MTLPDAIDSDRKPQWPIYATLVGILALAAFLRFHTLTERGFFFDELWNIQIANGHGSAFLNLPTDQLIEQPNTLTLANAKPIWSVPGNTTGVLHPPGLFVMLRAWRDVFGDSMFAIRSFSATWSTLVVLLVFIAGRLSFSPSAGLWAAFMSAVAFNNIDQAQDTRGYTLLQCVLLLTMIALLSSRGKPSAWLGAIAIGLGTLAMMFLHYFAASACAVVGVGVIVLLRGKARYQALGAIALASLVWMVAWLSHLRAQLAYVAETADGFLNDPSPHPLFSTLQRLLAAPYQAMIGDPRNLNAITLVGGAAIALIILLGLHFRRAEQRPAAFLWLATIVSVFGFLAMLDAARQTMHLQFPKYLILATPAICLLLGSIHIHRSWLVPAVASAVLVVLLFTTPTPPKPDERAATAWLKERVKPGDIVFLPSYNTLGRDGQVMSLYFAYGVPLEALRMIIPVRKPRASLIDALPHDVRWFYYSFDSAYSPADWLPRMEIVDRGPVGEGTVYEIRPRSTSATATSQPASRPTRTISVHRRWPDPTTRPTRP